MTQHLGLPMLATFTAVTEPNGPAAARINELWWVMFWIAAFVCVAVFVLLALALTRRRDRAGEGRPLSERFVVGDPTVPFQRDLALGGLPPGNYSLELTIEAAGRTVERRRGIVVR